MHVAEASRGGKAEPILGRDSREGVEIEGKRVHANAVLLPSPEFTRAIGVDFDAVTFWIGKIESFADKMVGGADKSPGVMRSVAEEGAKRFAMRDKNREMEEACRVFGVQAAIFECDEGEFKFAGSEDSGRGGFFPQGKAELAIERDLRGEIENL